MARDAIASGDLVGDAFRPSIKRVDITNPVQLRDVIRDVDPSVVINAAGTFFGSTSYDVPKLCIEETVDYLDISDDRSYVSNFSKRLDEEATKAGVTLLTAASTTLALSTAVVDKLS